MGLRPDAVVHLSYKSFIFLYILLYLVGCPDFVVPRKDIIVNIKMTPFVLTSFGFFTAQFIHYIQYIHYYITISIN